ncbi:MAG TPA: AtpZ/AtpI family protein [Nocardioidaceae bacterium]|nr:AtpZ/AtpI family protein [Nocardioidaceae bacterium]
MTGNVRPAMSQQGSPSAPRENRPQGDPWHAFGYVVSGVGLYGFLGWLADQWLGTSFLVAVGILVGAGLGIYMTFARFDLKKFDEQPDDEHHSDEQDK